MKPPFKKLGGAIRKIKTRMARLFLNQAQRASPLAP